MRTQGPANKTDARVLASAAAAGVGLGREPAPTQRRPTAAATLVLLHATAGGCEQLRPATDGPGPGYMTPSRDRLNTMRLTLPTKRVRAGGCFFVFTYY